MIHGAEGAIQMTGVTIIFRQQFLIVVTPDMLVSRLFYEVNFVKPLRMTIPLRDESGKMPDVFELINMNGRVYDPRIARFLSPDPLSVTNSQAFNRYSYCLNNPLKYTDPSGYSLEKNGSRKPLSFEERTPIITLASLFNGGSGSICPGSMNHWSDAYSNNYQLFFTMPMGKFDNMVNGQLNNPNHFSQVAIPYASAYGVTYSGETFQSLCALLESKGVYVYRLVTPYGEGIMTSDGKCGEMTIVDGAPVFENKSTSILLAVATFTSGGGGCGNLRYYTSTVNHVSFGMGLGSGMYGEATRGLTSTTSNVASEVQAAKFLGKVATAAKWTGYLGNTISIAANTVNVINDPNAANYARLAVNGVAVGLNLVNIVVPGLGTGLSLLVSTLDTAGGFNWLYNNL